MAETILIRCVDPRFGTEWAAPVLQAVGPHYCLTELGGISPLGKQGFHLLTRKIKIVLRLNPAIRRVVVLSHEDCAWCKGRNFSKTRRQELARRLARRLGQAFPGLSVETGEMRASGEVVLFSPPR